MQPGPRTSAAVNPVTETSGRLCRAIKRCFRRRSLVLTAALAVCIASTHEALARDIFVSNLSGDDRYQGEYAEVHTDRTGPVRTIGRALEVAVSGDRIVLADTGEPYRESLALVGSRMSGYGRQPFTILGNGAVLEGAEPVDPDRWEHVRDTVFRFRPRRLAYQQLFINDKPVPRILCSHPCTAPPELEPLEWCLFRGNIYFRTQPLKRPEDYALTVASRQVGITLFHVENVVIHDLIVQGFQLDGISAHNSARDIVLSHVTCRGNGRAGIAVGGASRVNVEASLVGNNGEAQLLTNPYSQTFVRQSNLLSNTAPAWIDRGGTVIVDGTEIHGGLDDRADSQP